MTKSIRKTGRQKDWQDQLFPNANPIAIWRNISNPDSLRLTDQARKKLTLPSYQFKIDTMTNLQILQLDHLMTAPYYIKNRRTIELFGEQDAMMLSLHANNLKQYLDNLDNE